MIVTHSLDATVQTDTQLYNRQIYVISKPGVLNWAADQLVRLLWINTLNHIFVRRIFGPQKA